MPDFEIRTVPRQDTAVIAVTSPLDAIGDSMGKAFEKVFHALGASGVSPTGPPFSRYFKFEEPIEYEAGAPIATPFAGDGDVKAGELGGVEAAVGMHVGPYDTLEQTYEAMMAWVKEQGRELSGPMWEVYLTDPGEEPDPSKWRTEVCIPLA